MLLRPTRSALAETGLQFAARQIIDAAGVYFCLPELFVRKLANVDYRSKTILQRKLSR